MGLLAGTPLQAARPVLRVLTTFDPAIRGVAEQVHRFEARYDCWVDWDFLERSEVEGRLFGSSIDYDVVSVDEPWVAALSGRLLPLADWPARDGIVREAHPLACWQGQCYGRMQLENYYNYVYRADVFADRELAEAFEARHGKAFTMPESIEAFLDLAQFFETASDYQGLAMVRTPPESVVIDLIWCLEASGVELSGEAMRTRPDREAVRLGLQRFRKMHRLSSKAKTAHSPEGLNQIYSRAEVPHVLQWSGFAEALRNPLFSRVGTKTGFRPLPGGDPGRAFYITGHWFLAIPSASRGRAELAAEFIDWYHARIEQDAARTKGALPRPEAAQLFSRPRSTDYRELSRRFHAVAEMLIESEAPLEQCAERLIRELGELEFSKHGQKP